MVCDGDRLVNQERCEITRYGPGKTLYGTDPACLIECSSTDNRYHATTYCGSYVWCWYGRKFNINVQLVLCSTKKVEAASTFTTRVSHAEQNHGRLGQWSFLFTI